jgi:hypothetical protein
MKWNDRGIYFTLLNWNKLGTEKWDVSLKPGRMISSYATPIGVPMFVGGSSLLIIIQSH